ncbi:MAG: hypothetical protein GY722_24355 [bacterium]|nr:hypothetical protein [bacterium]
MISPAQIAFLLPRRYFRFTSASLRAPWLGSMRTVMSSLRPFLALRPRRISTAIAAAWELVEARMARP